MRMTRAQAAALAAAEAEAGAGERVAENDNDNNGNENKNGNDGDEQGVMEATEDTGQDHTQEREVLGELTDVDAGKEEEDGLVSEEREDSVDEMNGEQEDGEAADGEVDGDKEEDRATSTPLGPVTNNTDKPNHIPIHQDNSLQPRQKDLDIGSPTTELPLLNITPQRTPAKNIIKNEFAHMRSTSNKENVVPDSPVIAGPVDRLQSHVELLGPAQEQSDTHKPHQVQHDEQSEQKTEPHDRQENGEAQPTKAESSQIEDGQDDSLIGHFEALQVSPKKAQAFSEQHVESETQPGAEQPAPEQPGLLKDKTNGISKESQEGTSKQPEKQTLNATVPGADKSAQNKPKALASPTARKPSPQPDTTKPIRKSSVRQSTVGRQSSVVRRSMAPSSRSEPPTNPAVKRTTSVKRSSVRPSMAPRAGSSQSTERPPANIPHSKPRPMSMSFPTPPPPTKSSKPPTQSTFQLPGEAVAAKLKADKEERLRRQAEAGTTAKPVYKPPPQPKSTKAPTKPTFQLPGEAIAAKLKQEKEERQKRQEETGAKKPAYIPPPMQRSTKPVTKATFQLSSDIFAAKMKAQKEERLKLQKAEEEKKEKERGVFKARPAPKTKTPAEVRQTNASRARLPSSETNGLVKRASSVRDPAATTKRFSSFHPSASSSSSSAQGSLPPRATTSFQKRQSMMPSSSSSSSSKGKEIFSRPAERKEKEDAAKREKEDAAKKARVEAAEKGRQASREWAARKKEKKMEGKRERESNANTAAVV